MSKSIRAKKKKVTPPNSEQQFVADLTNLFHMINDPDNDVIRQWLGSGVIHSLHLPTYNSIIYIVIPIARCYGISLEALDECARNVSDGKCGYSLQGFKFFCEMIHADEDSVRNVEFVALQKLIKDFGRANRQRNCEENEDLDPEGNVAASAVDVEKEEAVAVKIEEKKEEDKMDHVKLLKSAVGFLDAFTIGLRCCTLSDDYCDIFSALEDAAESSVNSHHCINDDAGSSVITTETIRILVEYCLQIIHCMKSMDLCLARAGTNGRDLKEKLRRTVGRIFGRSLRDERYGRNARKPNKKSNERYLSKHLAEAYRFMLPYIGMDSDSDITPVFRVRSRIASIKQRRVNMADYARHVFGYGHPAISQTLGKSLDAMNLPECAQSLSGFGPPNFRLCTANEDGTGDTRFHVHDWLLLARWPIIFRMMKSGMEESITRELFLSSDIDKTMLKAIVQCIYHPEFNPPYISTPAIDVDLLEEYELTRFAPLLPKLVVSDDEGGDSGSDYDSD